LSSEPSARTVLITGATDGLGRAAALLLAERGYHVFAAGRSVEKRAELQAIAGEKKWTLEAVDLDVCDDKSVQEAVGHVLAKAGAIDVLINNAGIGYMGSLEDLPIDRLHGEIPNGSLRDAVRAVLGSQQGCASEVENHAGIAPA
jgi:NAD(P)-dependent dehydrogenase (short-subunit alcohol dehydrogenase family)